MRRSPRPQTCKDCWRSDGIDFHVPDPLWRAVCAGSVWADGVTDPVLCLDCFDRRAERAGIDYAAAITVLGRRSWLAARVLDSAQDSLARMVRSA